MNIFTKLLNLDKLITQLTNTLQQLADVEARLSQTMLRYDEYVEMGNAIRKETAALDARKQAIEDLDSKIRNERQTLEFIKQGNALETQRIQAAETRLHERESELQNKAKEIEQKHERYLLDVDINKKALEDIRADILPKRAMVDAAQQEVQNTLTKLRVRKQQLYQLESRMESLGVKWLQEHGMPDDTPLPQGVEDLVTTMERYRSNLRLIPDDIVDDSLE